MTMRGTLVEIDGKLCVRYVTTFNSEPVQQTCYWPCVRVARDPYNGSAPMAGDVAMSRGSGTYGTSRPGIPSTGSVSVDGSAEAIRVDREPVPPPKVRKGIEVRWYQGGWQKLMAKGWVPA